LTFDVLKRDDPEISGKSNSQEMNGVTKSKTNSFTNDDPIKISNASKKIVSDWDDLDENHTDLRSLLHQE
jgi:hypothetical protein